MVVRTSIVLGIPQHGDNNFDTGHNSDVILTLASHTPFVDGWMYCTVHAFADQLVTQRVNAKVSQVAAMMAKHLRNMSLQAHEATRVIFRLH